MAAAAGIWNHQLSAGQALTGKSANPLATSTSDASSSSDDPSTISANDFLTLLVTEMQNQDPTANTDPNEYINQLVQVNSLEQLININQTLSTDLTAPTTTSSGGTVSGQTAGATNSPAAKSANPQAQGSPHRGGVSTPGNSTSTGTASAQASAIQQAHGNLSVPGGNASARRRDASPVPHPPSRISGAEGRPYRRRSGSS